MVQSDTVSPHPNPLPGARGPPRRALLTRRKCMRADALLTRARAMKDELVAVRRDIHRHPELAFQEQRTAEKGRNWLQGLGLEMQDGIAGTYGLVATLDTGRPGSTLLI